MKKIVSIVIMFLIATTLTACVEDDAAVKITDNVIEDSENVILNQPDEDSIIDDELVIDDVEWGANAALSSESLTLEKMLLYAMQDEYSARAEYEYIIDNFDITKPFTNIMDSEVVHIGLLEPLFQTYSITVPLDTSNEHIVTIDDLKMAFETGVHAEIINIAMYNLFLEGTLPDDVRDVFVSLRDASMNHLSAFEKNLLKYS